MIVAVTNGMSARFRSRFCTCTMVVKTSAEAPEEERPLLPPHQRGDGVLRRERSRGVGGHVIEREVVWRRIAAQQISGAITTTRTTA